MDGLEVVMDMLIKRGPEGIGFVVRSRIHEEVELSNEEEIMLWISLMNFVIHQLTKLVDQVPSELKPLVGQMIHDGVGSYKLIDLKAKEKRDDIKRG